MSQFIRDLFKNEKMIGKGLAMLTMVVLILTVTTTGTFAAFWRTVAGNTNPYQTATSLSNASTFTYGYGYSGSSLWGYGYGYGYNVNNALGYLVGDEAYTNVTAVTASTLSSVATITGTASAATNVSITTTASLTGTTTAGNTITAVLPADLDITTATGIAFNSTALAAASSTLTNAELGSGNAPFTIISFGVSGSNLRFDNPVQLTIPVPSAVIGNTVSIGALHGSDTIISSTSLGTSSSTCSAGVASPSASTTTVTSANTIVIYTCAASKFVAYATDSTTTTTTTTTTSSGGGGGGGGISRCRDEQGRYINGESDSGGNCKVKVKTTTTVAVNTTVDTFKPGETAPLFRDIATHWAKGFIETLRAAGIIHGKTVGYFQPNAPLTRAELVKIAMNAFGHTVADSVSVKAFSDTEAAMWYTPYLVKAKQLGVVQGYADGTFRPNQTINRAEALKILLAASGLNIAASSTSSFSDVGATAWFAKYVEYAKVNGVVGGYGNGQFGPGNPVLRGEMAKMAVLTMGLN